MVIQPLALKMLAPQVMLLEVNTVEMCRKALLLKKLQVCIVCFVSSFSMTLVLSVDSGGDMTVDLGKVDSFSYATRGKVQGQLQKGPAAQRAPGTYASIALFYWVDENPHAISECRTQNTCMFLC